MHDRLTKTVAQAPSAPGVYLFKDAHGKAIYVGKARSLADRLRSYVGAQADARHEALVAEAADLDFITTPSEVEALVLEENLIKLNKPRYNVRLKDDKKFPYLKILVKDRFPTLLVTRNLKPDGSLFFGPYTNAKTLRKAVKAARRIFMLRSCRKPLDPEKPERPCLNFHMKRCSGPCQGTETAADYQARVRAVRAFLTGRNEELETELEKRMWAASERSDFETAATLRDQLFALRQIKPHAPVTFGDKVPRDAIGLVLGEKTAHATILKVREGKLISKDDFDLSIMKNTSQSDILELVLRSCYGHTYDVPQEILLPGAVEEVEAFVEWFRQKRDLTVEIYPPDRGPRRGLVRMAQRNAELEFHRKEHVPRVHPANVELGRILGLANPPRRLEGLDISNTSGRQAVGSIVVFSDSRPLKTEYRRFRIKTVAGPDDYAMMAEVVRRRVKRQLAEEKPLPDLLLIDGGPGQLSTVARVYGEFKRPIPMLGFAKRTDLVYYVDGREIQIPARSPALRLLKQVRDEAHRFAITYHRMLRGKAMTDTLLEHLPGVGRKRKLALIRHFGSPERIRGASVEELRQVPGIGGELARKLREAMDG